MLRYLRFPGITFGEGTRVNGKVILPAPLEVPVKDEEGTLVIEYWPEDSATPIRSVYFQTAEEYNADMHGSSMVLYFVIGCLTTLFFYLIAITVQSNYNRTYLKITLIIGISLWRYLTSESLFTHPEFEIFSLMGSFQP